MCFSAYGPQPGAPWFRVSRGALSVASFGQASSTGRVGSLTPASFGTVAGTAGVSAPAGGAIAARGDVTLQLTQHIDAGGITDPVTFAQQVTDKTVAAVIDVLDITQQQAGTPVSRVLPGAI
jgi:hypothetical protein